MLLLDLILVYGTHIWDVCDDFITFFKFLFHLVETIFEFVFYFTEGKCQHRMTTMEFGWKLDTAGKWNLFLLTLGLSVHYIDKALKKLCM